MVAGGQVLLAEILLEKLPEDVDVKTDKGETPLHLAVASHTIQTKYILDNSRPNYRFIPYPGLSSSIDMTRMLLQKGADFKAQDIEGNTPLHIAFCKENFWCARILLRQPTIDINIANKAGITPLQLAQDKNQHKLWKLCRK
jgi:ankyrin repeat protein